MVLDGKKHSCPQCGLQYRAEVVIDGDAERLEIHYDGGASPKSDDEQLAERIDQLRAEWTAEYEAKHSQRATAKEEDDDFIL